MPQYLEPDRQWLIKDEVRDLIRKLYRDRAEAEKLNDKHLVLYISGVIIALENIIKPPF